MAKSGALHHHDPDDLRRMAVALDRVWERLPDSDQSDATRRRLAARIVRLFEQGERDPDRLSDIAFAEMFPEREDDHPAY